MTKNLDPSPMAKNRRFSGLGKERRTSRATSRPLDPGSTYNFGGRHLYSLALPETKGVDRGFILYRDRRCVVGWFVENRRQQIPITLLSEAKKIVCSGLSEEQTTDPHDHFEAVVCIHWPCPIRSGLTVG